MEQSLKGEACAEHVSQHMPSARKRATAWLLRLAAAGRQWWAVWWTDERIAYLSQAENPVDLEYRIRRWNERDRRGRMPLL